MINGLKANLKATPRSCLITSESYKHRRTGGHHRGQLNPPRQFCYYIGSLVVLVVEQRQVVVLVLQVEGNDGSAKSPRVVCC